MSIELAEKLKQKLTDKWVVVDASVPELKRFAQWTGKVKTVNMSGRALVEFDGPVDIGWYDIDPAYLTVVDGPKPKAVKAETKHAPAPAAKPAATPAATGGGSPLDKIRAQQAAKAAGGAPAAAAPAAGGAKLSPLEMIRQQQAAKAAGAAAPAPTAPAPVASAEPAPAAAPPVAAPKPPVPTTGPDGKPLSKLDQIRMQGAAKK